MKLTFLQALHSVEARLELRPGQNKTRATHGASDTSLQYSFILNTVEE